MKIYQEKNEEILSFNNEQGEEISFEISNNDEVIIDMLRRNYAYPIQTPVQEYLCNARDATREAKNNKKIVVYIPNSLEPSFRVRDFGVGLSPDRVRNVFTKYGESTKRSNNEQTGGYGIGAKSAFIYSDSFTVISYYEGIKYTYLAIRSKNKEKGSFNCIKKEKTTEENGVEVIIPVNQKDFKEFERSVYRATFFWETRPEIKGISEFEIPKEYLYPDFKYKNQFGGFYKIDEKFEFGLVKKEIKNTYNYYNNERPGILLVVDGIPYKNIFDNYSSYDFSNKDYTQVLFFKTGQIKLPPHREEIIKDSENDSFTLKTAKSFFKTLKNEIQDKLKKEESASKLFELIKDMNNCVQRESINNIIVGRYNSFFISLIEKKEYSSESEKISIEFKNKIVEKTYSATTSRRGGLVKNVNEEITRNLIVSLDEKEKIFYFKNDTKEDHKKLIPRIKKHLNEKYIRDSDIYIQILEQEISASINISSITTIKTPNNNSKIKNNDYVVYFELSKKGYDEIYDRYGNLLRNDMIRRESNSISKKEVMDISNTVFLETEKNSLHKKYSPLSESLQQSIICYLLKNGVKVIAFSEKNRSFFKDGIDFKDLKDSLLKKFPLSSDLKDSYLASFLYEENKNKKDSDLCLFNNYYNYLEESDIDYLLKKVKKSDFKNILKIKKLMLRCNSEKDVFFNSEFFKYTLNNDLKKDIELLKKHSGNFIESNYALRFCSSVDSKKLEFLAKYINEGNK